MLIFNPIAHSGTNTKFYDYNLGHLNVYKSKKRQEYMQLHWSMQQTNFCKKSIDQFSRRLIDFGVSFYEIS